MSCAFLCQEISRTQAIMTSTDWAVVNTIRSITKVIGMTRTRTRDSYIDPGVLSQICFVLYKIGFARVFEMIYWPIIVLAMVILPTPSILSYSNATLYLCPSKASRKVSPLCFSTLTFTLFWSSALQVAECS